MTSVLIPMLAAIFAALSLPLISLRSRHLKGEHHSNKMFLRRLSLANPLAFVWLASTLALGASLHAQLLGVGAIFVAVGAYPFYCYLKGGWARADICEAAEATHIAHSCFENYIHTGGELIGRKDLKLSLAAPRSAHEEIAARYMLKHFEDIGHVVSTSSKKGLMPVGVTGGVYATKKTVRAYGISRDDLKTYADRLRKRHARWL